MITTFLLIVLCLLVGIVLYLLLTKKNTTDTTTVEWIKSTQQEIRSLQQTLTQASQISNQQLSQNMREQTRDIHERLAKAADVIGELKREAGAFSEVSRSMKELHEFLKSPKLRGSIGEQVLNDIIAQTFPKQSFFIQHRFKNGAIVDIALQTDAGILPIDSKFPMENFQMMVKGETAGEREAARKLFIKDVKRHIDDIAQKYILPDEGTMDFALMYIPSESVYYEIAIDESILAYARSKRVYPVSPTTLYAHLQTILLSFEGKKIETKSKELFAHLRSIEHSYAQVEAAYETLGRHITNAHSSYTNTATLLSGLGRHVASAKQIGTQAQELITDGDGKSKK